MSKPDVMPRSAISLFSLALLVITVVAASRSDAGVVSSASGAKIAFVSDRAGGFDIYVMEANGGGLRRLTASTTDDLSPAWSPDGTKIAFATDSGYVQSKGAFASLHDENYDIYVMSVDGTGVRRLTAQSGDLDRHFCDDQLDPAWSPDGTKIAFTSNHAGNFEIYLMNANGSGWQRLTRKGAVDESPAWSPDGRKIAFASSRGSHSEINVMNADGSGRRRLARNPAGIETYYGCANPPPLPRPAWSSTGKIAFERFRGYESSSIDVMNADGNRRRRLTRREDAQPSWSPDGSRIAFARYRKGKTDIYLMNADGSGPRRLTGNRAVDILPTWQPGPRAERANRRHHRDL